MTNVLLRSVPDSERAVYGRFRDSIMESPRLLKKSWLDKSDWVAVPQRQHGFVSMVEMERLSKTLRDVQVDELRFIYPTDPSVQCNCKALSTTVDALATAAGIGAFEALAIGAWDYLITNAGEPLFVYHYTADDFTLLAGKSDFVEAALAASIEAARNDWHAYSSHPGWSKSEMEVYGEIEQWYGP